MISNYYFKNLINIITKIQLLINLTLLLSYLYIIILIIKFTKY